MAGSGGFLTEEQREVLKMESQNAEVMASLSLSVKSPGRMSPGWISSVLSEHHFLKVSGSGYPSALHSGKFITVKKDGTGGEGTWDKLLDTDGESLTEDWKKTNENVEKLRRYKEEIVTIIHEYFLSDDITELIRSLEDLKMPQKNPIFLKKLVTLALDRRNREKEMASVLLSVLHIEIFSTEDIINGFIMLLESAEDTALDILDASNELAFFLARAIIDDVLTPLNLEEIASRLPPNCGGSEIVRSAQSLIAARHAGERILRCWGGGTGWAVEDAKDKIQKLLEEYESGGVLNEACQCIRDLGMPFFNHEVVKKALVMAMEKKNDRILDLLQVCFGEGLITITQMTKGFSRIRDGLEDLALDVPNAKDKFGFYVRYAGDRGWLSPSFAPAEGDVIAAYSS